MISWMQKHNKYLVWTIWIATIAFIGAGFVGWGSYNLGSKAGNVAQVGDIEIKQGRLNTAYSNLYGQYNQMMQGKLDEKKAREMGLIKQAFSTLAVQAKILNFAKDAGIIASDKEVAKRIGEIKGFQKEGIFNREIYDNYLISQRLKAKEFEATLEEEIIIQKTLALLHTESLPLEEEVVGAAMNVADKIAYKVLTSADVNYTSDENKVKTFWETQKENYMTKKSYNLSLVWTASSDTIVSDEEIKEYFDANSFNYTDAAGKQLKFDAAKEKASADLKLKNTKKSAQKAYIAFKKGELKSSEEITLSLGDLKLSQEIWTELETKSVGDILKPKIVGSQYVTIKINNTEASKVMTYEQAKDKVKVTYDVQAKKEALLTLADNTLNTFVDSNATVSDFMSLNKHDNLKSLNSQESLQFLQKLFTSNKEKGIISVIDKVIVYNIVEQKLLSVDGNDTENVKQTVNDIKKKMFESNLIKMLDSKYPTEVYMEGLIN
jgi:peptidyl-prolyl cis-trans isomerase D